MLQGEAKIKSFLKRANATQQHISQAVGYHKSSVSLILAGRRGSSTRFAAKFLTYCEFLAVEAGVPAEEIPTLMDLASLVPPPKVTESLPVSEEGEGESIDSTSGIALRGPEIVDQDANPGISGDRV